MASEAIRASVMVPADPETVFEYFTRAEAMNVWMGEWADLDARVGGVFAVDIKGVAVRGEYLAIERPRRLLISWGHAGSEHLPPGSSTVEVLFRATAEGTAVEILHSGLPEPEAREHPAGWRHFLAALAIAVDGEGPRPNQDRS